MTLTDFYNTLPKPTLGRNKYEMTAQVLGFNYRLLSGRQVYNSSLPSQIKQFVMENSEVILLPNIYSGNVIGFLLRSISKKAFRYYSEYPIPYGAGVNNKKYNEPWVIVESCLDSDFLRSFYPYVIATLGVTVSNSTLDFLFSTSPFVIVGFDNDDAGNNAYRNLFFKYKGRVKKMEVPLGKKDFGDTLQLLCSMDYTQYDIESLYIKQNLKIITEL